MNKYTMYTTYLDRNWKIDTSKTANQKARTDIQYIAHEQGQFEYVCRVVSARKGVTSLLDTVFLCKLQLIKKYSIFLLQYPTNLRYEYTCYIMSVLKRKKCKIALFIHDLSGVRFGDKTLLLNEKKILEQANVIISHNEKMTECLRKEYGLFNKIVDLGIFDYLMDTSNGESRCVDRIIVAGNLDLAKAGYLTTMASQNPRCRFSLYGTNYTATEDENVAYFGSFPSNELPRQLNGRWGLIWDGKTTSTCSGNYGEYLKINNPHKTSLYIAAGIPVIVWSQSAMADYVRNRGVGIVVDDIEHLAEDTGLTDEAYGVLFENVKRESERIRTGYYTRRALQQAEQLLLENK